MADQYAETTGTIIELRGALRNARLDLKALKAQRKTRNRWTRFSVGPFVGATPECNLGVCGVRATAGISLTWDWLRIN